MKPDRDKKHFSLAFDQLRLPVFAGRNFSRPFVVALEGANGAGKTTLCHLLARSLEAHACLGTDEAWFSDAFKIRMIRDAEWFVSAMFFFSGCFEQMRVLRARPNRLSSWTARFGPPSQFTEPRVPSGSKLCSPFCGPSPTRFKFPTSRSCWKRASKPASRALPAKVVRPACWMT